MKVLVICDDFYHPADVVRKGLQPLNREFEFDFIEDAKEWSEQKMKKYDAVIFSKADNVSSSDTTPWLTSEVEEVFERYVNQGGGLFVIHTGTTGYENSEKFKSLIGGVFNHHPQQCEIKVQVTRKNPIIDENISFTLKEDEHYFMDMQNTSEEVFMVSTSINGTQPAGWLKTIGKGRICVITPGHNVEVWVTPEIQQILKNAIKWCAGII